MFFKYSFSFLLALTAFTVTIYGNSDNEIESDSSRLIQDHSPKSSQLSPKSSRSFRRVLSNRFRNSFKSVKNAFVTELSNFPALVRFVTHPKEGEPGTSLCYGMLLHPKAILAPAKCIDDWSPLTKVHIVLPNEELMQPALLTGQSKLRYVGDNLVILIFRNAVMDEDAVYPHLANKTASSGSTLFWDETASTSTSRDVKKVDTGHCTVYNNFEEENILCLSEKHGFEGVLSGSPYFKRSGSDYILHGVFIDHVDRWGAFANVAQLKLDIEQKMHW